MLDFNGFKGMVDAIDGVEIASLIGGSPAGTEAVAKKYGIAHWGNDLAEGIARADADCAWVALGSDDRANAPAQGRPRPHRVLDTPMSSPY